ncbi:LLM class F420-dependent oxidoreductase [Mycolicibacterium litorale]|uniref:LLM class F420-dependent oxidoreductase n=1 Tax=Mycolicibacterium litorale TaxID=758802 RepID=A0AAD1IJV9_9MYCO|nr:LLM class F420-dependent oxidoreductase [Mycolicibacterium litorale]MCV7415490.1 LLM class F420-dependent oxidoreductase [Mycolicibacterium litorale]TDY08745.1 putative F420-dependent oxidoreductase [Mycolicibacterium litorale]BBY16670.1 LLM class F420-dependent oxidoreductase [Mycolicibacterium litorale]
MIASAAHLSRPLRFGLTTALPRAGADTRDFARAVESAGFDVLTFADHLVPAMPPFSGAAAAAVATERLHVGTLVLNNDFRHPVETARESAGVSTVSDGRFELGLGAGHMKSEYDAAGIPFDRSGIRVERLEESVGIIRALLDGDAVDADGAHYRVHTGPGALLPAPPHRVPLLIGGNGERVLRLAGRVADIAGFAGITHNHDATEVALTHFGPDGLDNRIAVVRDAAGDRFDQIELNALIQAVVVTGDREAAAADLAGAISGVDPADLLDSPFVLLGTHEQMAQMLHDRQQRFGVSYWTVFDEWGGRPSAMPDLAEVIRLLR